MYFMTTAEDWHDLAENHDFGRDERMRRQSDRAGRLYFSLAIKTVLGLFRAHAKMSKSRSKAWPVQEAVRELVVVANLAQWDAQQRNTTKTPWHGASRPGKSGSNRVRRGRHSRDRRIRARRAIIEMHRNTALRYRLRPAPTHGRTPYCSAVGLARKAACRGRIALPKSVHFAVINPR